MPFASTKYNCLLTREIKKEIIRFKRNTMAKWQRPNTRRRQVQFESELYIHLNQIFDYVRKADVARWLRTYEWIKNPEEKSPSTATGSSIERQLDSELALAEAKKKTGVKKEKLASFSSSSRVVELYNSQSGFIHESVRMAPQRQQVINPPKINGNANVNRSNANDTVNCSNANDTVNRSNANDTVNRSNANDTVNRSNANASNHNAIVNGSITNAQFNGSLASNSANGNVNANSNTIHGFHAIADGQNLLLLTMILLIALALSRARANANARS